MGETGAGKTTLVNTMINYLLGVRFEDEDFYQITEEEEEHKDQSQSQTSYITVYEVFVEESPTSLTIIDTPGYADTKGFKREREISEYLRRLFSEEDGIHYIDAVCFVMKASQNQLSGKEDYIFHLVLSLFGRDIKDNIVFIITHSDGVPTDALNAINTAKIQCRRDERKKPVHFSFNNQQREKREHTYKTSWKMGKKSMEMFLELLSKNNRKSLLMTLDSLKERKQLEACIFNVIDHITEKESKMEELIEILKAIRQNRDKISENFMFTVNKTVKEKVSIEDESVLSRNATCCNDCQENCHRFGCWFVKSEDLSKCDVMTDNYCTVCTNKCPSSRHVKQNTIYVIRQKHVKMTFDELKQEYECTSDQPEASFHKTKHEDTRKEHEKDMKESENTTKIEEKLNYDLEEIKKHKSILLHKAYTTIMNLSMNPLITDSYITPQHLKFFIPRMEREGEDEMVKDLHKVREAIQEQKNRLSNRNWLVRVADTSLSGLQELGVPGLNLLQTNLRK